jgi:hypothetical protein
VKTRRRNAPGIIGPVVIAAMSLVIACSVEEKVEPLTPEQSKEALAQVSSKVGLVFPPNAQLIGTSHDRGIDTLVRLKIATTQAGFDEFIRANAIDRAGFEEAQRVLLMPDASWWDPSKASSLPTVQLRREGGATLNIGYAAAPGGRVEVYVAWFTT